MNENAYNVSLHYSKAVLWDNSVVYRMTYDCPSGGGGTIPLNPKGDALEGVAQKIIREIDVLAARSPDTPFVFTNSAPNAFSFRMEDDKFTDLVGLLSKERPNLNLQIEKN